MNILNFKTDGYGKATSTYVDRWNLRITILAVEVKGCNSIFCSVNSRSLQPKKEIVQSCHS